jgi:hypothetical protein
MRPLFVLIAVFIMLGGCSSRDKCAANTALHEDHCPKGEAARCYFLIKPVDGF